MREEDIICDLGKKVMRVEGSDTGTLPYYVGLLSLHQISLLEFIHKMNGF